ncbi:MAG: PAS domain S-box protein, partial [Nitrospirales bacterium]
MMHKNQKGTKFMVGDNAHKALGNSDTNRDQFFKLSRDFMCLIGLDGYLKKINPAVESFLGYTPEELFSQPFLRFIHPDDQASTRTALTTLAEGNVTLDFHNRIRHRHGKYLRLEWRATFRVQEQTIYAVARDITQHHSDTQALRRYDHIVSTSSDFLCFLDAHNCFQTVNHCFSEYFNRPARDIIGHHIRDFVGQDVFESQLKFHLDDCRKGRGVCFQQKLKFPDGSLRILEARLNPYLESDGSISGVSATWRDLTEQKRLEQHVTQTQKMESIGTLAGGIAHDFNNILMAILGWAEMGSWKFPQEDPAQKYFEQIGIAGKRGRDLVQQILTFSRQTEHHPRPIDLGPIIEESIAFLRATFPSNIDLRFDSHQHMNIVFADSMQIQRIIMNLCSNAEHALRTTGGTLKVKLETIAIKEGHSQFPPSLEPGNYAQITVSDSGPGIPEYIHQKIFDPFFTTKPVGEGTGMGLSVVHGIVKNLQGHISVESSAESGTAFYVTIPEYTMPTGQDPLPNRPAIPPGSGHILFVDDEVAITQILQEFLQHLGYTVTVRGSALEALETFRTNPHQFDCLITDQTMPVMSGDKLAREIFKIRSTTPIILCTGFSHTIDKEKALAQGITAFL